MYKNILVFIIVLSCYSCNNEPELKDTSVADSVNITANKQAPQLSDLPWTTAINTETGNTHLQQMPGNSSAITPQQVIAAANKKYPQIHLEWIKKEGTTVYLKITDANYLTQSMGSAGAEAYLSEITYSFTEVEGIKSINLTFAEGDHAAPGTYTRDQFKSLRN
ncbi:MAG TPA: hypothetical protein VNI52_14060 [Sphingobacteriaceae bacterium]|nr:hypothetical protein [Sphingobacteriaceae bacterium]